MKKFAIVGSREFPDKELVENITQQLIDDYPDFILVSGGARGVDTWASDVAIKNSKISIACIPDWNRYGRRAGAIRNQIIVDKADMILAFWSNQSCGTKITIDMAIKSGKPLNIYMRTK